MTSLSFQNNNDQINCERTKRIYCHQLTQSLDNNECAENKKYIDTTKLLARSAQWSRLSYENHIALKRCQFVVRRRINLFRKVGRWALLTCALFSSWGESDVTEIEKTREEWNGRTLCEAKRELAVCHNILINSVQEHFIDKPSTSHFFVKNDYLVS